MDAKFEYAKVSCIVNIVFKMATSTHAQFPILPEESWVTNNPDTYGRGLNFEKDALFYGSLCSDTPLSPPFSCCNSCLFLN